MRNVYVPRVSTLTVLAIHCRKMSRRAQPAVQNRYARCPMASPSAKYSKSASSVTRATASATIAVNPPTTKPTTNGIKTTAVATRFQVIEKESPQKLQASSHHIERNKSRKRSRTDILVCANHGAAYSLFDETDTVAIGVLYIHFSGAPGLVHWSGVNPHTLLDEFRVESIHVLNDQVDRAARNPITGKRRDVQPDTIARQAHVTGICFRVIHA